MSGSKHCSGGRRPGSGRRPLPVADLQLLGSFRPARHAVRAAATAPAVPCGETAPEDVTTGLVGRGLRFVTDAWTAYAGWTPTSRALLHEAGCLLDDLDTLRGKRDERSAQRLLLSTLAQLHLEDD